ncbi:MAG TPA: AsmA family protein [Terracidiphilus sp.]|nr:AsmA family protein [Terracidiphilus sp.]
MIEDEQGRQKKHRRLWLALAVLVAILAVLIVPPLVSVSRYTSRITSLMSDSLGRPVRLSSVRVRLLPRPGFVLDDLAVEEDPAFGAEPLLHASTVTANIRMLSLWRGRLEISEISVDDASLNLVRSPDGRWNLDSLLHTAATKAGTAAAGGAHAPPFPYLAASNSRINFKNGVEKLPFSVVDTDLSFWQEDPGKWRIRLRGQPARTDVSLDLADTGVVELDATAQHAPDLRQMPIHLDLEWRDAQLGQLTRLATGSDAGWRGDMRGEVHVDGTADVAQVKTRLRATGVHRAEFAPAAPMDFDANCAFVYHYSARALQNLVCDSPLGNGHVRLAGDLPANGGMPHFSVELDRIPVAAGLDALRTVRRGIGPGLQAAGTVSGKVSYAESPAANGVLKKSAGPAKTHSAMAGAAAPTAGPLTGSFTVEGFALSGESLSRPIQAPKTVLEPAAVTQGHAQALAGTAAIPEGGAVPLTVNVRLGLKGYQVTLRGQASIVRGRELARAAGLSEASALDALAGDPLAVDLTAEGPWMQAEEIPFSNIAPVRPATNAARVAAPGALSGAASGPANTKPAADGAASPVVDSLSGTVTVHNANWKADYLANHVEISEATLHVNLVGGVGDSRWDPVAFSYGPLKGTASLTIPASCDPPVPCPTRLQVQFGDLDAETVQTAALGAHEKGTLLSDLIDRLHPASSPVWPPFEGTVKIDSLILGPVTLKDATVELNVQPNGAEITSFDATVLGGSLHAAGTLETGDKPAYTLTGDFKKLNATAVGRLLGENWRGGTLDANGKIELSGYTGADLAGSAKGTLHFEWRHGSVASEGGTFPAPLAHFDRWTADSEIANGKITMGHNEVAQGGRKRTVEAAVTLAEPPKVSFAAPKAELAKKR